MRKGWGKVVAISCAFVGCTIFGFAWGAYGSDGLVHKSLDAIYNGYSILVDGTKVDSPLEPFNADSHIYVPAAPLAKALGGSVGWDGQHVIVTSRDGYQTTPEEAGTRYQFPGHGGASILLPDGSTTGKVPNMLLAADLQGGGSVMIGRLDRTGASLSASADVVMAILKAQLPSFTQTDRHDATLHDLPAIEISGQATLGPVSLPLTVQVLDDGTNLWAVVGMGEGSAVTKTLATFSPGQ